MAYNLEAINGSEAVKQLADARAAASTYFEDWHKNKLTALINQEDDAGIVKASQAYEATKQATQITGNFPKIEL